MLKARLIEDNLIQITKNKIKNTEKIKEQKIQITLKKIISAIKTASQI